MAKKFLFPLLLSITLASCGEHNSSDNKTPPVEETAAEEFIKQGDVTIFDLGPVVDDSQFPEIHIKGNKKIEDKINTFLQVERLNHLPGIFKDNPFELIADKQDSSRTENFYEYLRNATTANIFSITLRSSTTGSYNEENNFYYNFDLRTGNRILLTSLFTDKGLKEFVPILNQRLKAAIDDYINAAPPPDQDTTEDSSAKADYNLSSYRDRLKNFSGDKIGYYDFYFTNDSIVFMNTTISSKYMASDDDAPEFTAAIALKDFKKYLSQYGQSLLNGRTSNVHTSSPQGKLYKGLLDGKYPINAMISKISSDSPVCMWYWYSKAKIPIEWSGSFENSHFSLTEFQKYGQGIKAAQIEADWVNNKKIVGTWTNSKTNEVLKLELEAY